MRSLADQFVHDMKASWQKTAVLVVLFIVGLVFWVPPLIRMVSGRDNSPPVAVAAQPAAAQPSVNASGAGSTESIEQRNVPIDWKDADRLLATDPLAQSAEWTANPRKPFRIDYEQFPPPVLFADEDDASDKLVVDDAPTDRLPNPVPLKTPDELILKSTIVGATRRAAYINSRLYYEGKQVRTREGNTYLVTAIYPRRVVLTREQETYELTIVHARDADDVGIRQE